MARSVNKVTLIGNLGKYPEIKEFNDGNKSARLSVATSDEWVDKASGEKKSKTEWHNVICRGKLADICEKYLSIGSKVYIEGRLQTRKFLRSDGSEGWATEIICNFPAGEFLMLDSGKSTSKENREGSPLTKGGFSDEIPF